MSRKIRYSFLILVLLFGQLLYAQPCSNSGQIPPLAIPVCGSTDFIQDNVSLCDGKTVPVPPCNNGTNYVDKNPFWYKFKCFQSGTLGFLIVPKMINEDYDWQLFDVTGHNPNDVYVDPSLFVSCNWSGEYGNTGTIPNTTAVNSCSSPVSGPGATPNETAMPNIYAGHDYLLMVSHFTDTQYGYEITFGGGTAVITDTTHPGIQQVSAYCDGSIMNIVLNKKLLCSSLAADGSDFALSPPVANVIKAVSNCSGGYDMDSIQLTLNKPLAPGNYNIVVQNGTDGNTVLDVCGNFIPVGTSSPVTVYPLVETPMDSISPVDSCNPTTVQLVFRKLIKCGSIAANGSDFNITGPSPVTVTNAYGQCNAGALTYTITLKLAKPIFQGGNYSVNLQKGTDGNTIIDECNFETTPQSKSFYVKQAVSAQFSYQLKYSCKYADTVYYLHDGNNNTLTWSWTFDNGTTSNLQFPNPLVYNYNGIRMAYLKVTNKECSDTASLAVPIVISNYKASFDASAYVCPLDQATFTNTSTGNISNYYWDLGNGITSTLQTPPNQSYLTVGEPKDYSVQLIVIDTTYGLSCSDTTYRTVIAIPSCLIAVPSAFTPNGDGLNDYLYPLHAYKAQNLHFKVYNRYGQLVFETTDWTKKWDGTVNGVKQDPGTYVWMLQYIDGNSGKPIAQKGTVVLIR